VGVTRHFPASSSPSRSPPGGRAARLLRLASLASLLLLLPGACQREPPPAPAAEGWRSFQGSWSAAGDRHVLELGAGHRAAVTSLSGSMVLRGERGLGVGFQARAVAFTDDLTGMIGRAVWTDERGDQIFSQLEGDPLASGRRVAGTITGGTGRWAGITGEYRFDWEYVVEGEEGRVQGRAADLRGRARLGPAPAPGEAPR